MKVVILAGGYGTRISEESVIRPKPMVEIGSMPILWHIMKVFGAQGFSEFIICCGYKGFVIKEYFANYHLHKTDFSLDLANNKIEFHKNGCEKWRVTLVDTGEKTMTGGRLKRIRDYVGNETFLATYGDGLSDINLARLIAHHKKNKALATLTAVQPPGRFGAFTLSKNQAKISSFWEKPVGDGAWINGGFFVFEPEIFKYIKNEAISLENEPFRDLAHDGKLFAYKHTGFWQCMDTLRDKHVLEDLWQSGHAPWKIWK